MLTRIPTRDSEDAEPQGAEVAMTEPQQKSRLALQLCQRNTHQ